MSWVCSHVALAGAEMFPVLSTKDIRRRCSLHLTLPGSCGSMTVCPVPHHLFQSCAQKNDDLLSSFVARLNCHSRE